MFVWGYNNYNMGHHNHHHHNHNGGGFANALGNIGLFAMGVSSIINVFSKKNQGNVVYNNYPQQVYHQAPPQRSCHCNCNSIHSAPSYNTFSYDAGFNLFSMPAVNNTFYYTPTANSFSTPMVNNTFCYTPTQNNFAPVVNNTFSYTAPAVKTYTPNNNIFAPNQAVGNTNPVQQNSSSRKTGTSSTNSSSKMSNDKAFEKAMEFTFRAEGGYVNDPVDRGGETNMGMTQKTYDAYRKEKGLPNRSVKDLTKEEVKQIYYEKFWVGSGANKISDPEMAIAFFDTATLHGISKAKELHSKCGGDVNKLLQLRRQHFDNIIANNPSQQRFHKGWNNRITNLQNHLNTIA